MKENVSFNRFSDAFIDMNRENNFSYKGRSALYEYLINLEEETGKEIEMDIISFCCDYSEYKDLNDYLNDYYTTEEIDEKLNKMFNINQEKDLTEEQRQEFKEKMEEEINDKTTLIKFGDDLDEGFIIQSY